MKDKHTACHEIDNFCTGVMEVINESAIGEFAIALSATHELRAVVESLKALHVMAQRAHVEFESDHGKTH